MTRQPNPDLESALGQAIAVTEQALGEGWLKPSGESAQANLQLLRGILERARHSLRASEPLNAAELRGLVRWVADWVPDLESPLLKALGVVKEAMKGSL